MADFEPIPGYSSQRTSTVFTNGEDKQRAEFTYNLGSDWTPNRFDEDKTSVVCSNGGETQRAVVVYCLNGEGGGGGGGKYVPQWTELPTTGSYNGYIVQYSGPTIDGGYVNGYFYKCTTTSTQSVTFETIISCDINDFTNYISEKFPDTYTQITNGTMTYDISSGLWTFDAKNSSGVIIGTDTEYQEDFARDYNFIFDGEPEDGQVIPFVYENTTANVWNRVDVQPTGTINYEDLTNLPKINNVTLIGNKSTSDLGLSSVVFKRW